MAAPKGNKFAKGNKGGRPTKFKPNFAAELVEYFDIEPYNKEVAEINEEYYANGSTKKKSEKYRLLPNKMPTLFRFSKKIGVDFSTVYRWAEKGEWTDSKLPKRKEPPKSFQEFRNAYKEAKEIQKEFLITIGLAGAAPSPFAIFTAKNVTDMKDKTEVDNNHNVEINLNDKQIEQLLRARANRSDT